MAKWYNPRTWFKKEEKEVKDIAPTYQGVKIVTGGSGGTQIIGAGGTKGVPITKRSGGGGGSSGGGSSSGEVSSSSGFSSADPTLNTNPNFPIQKTIAPQQKRLTPSTNKPTIITQALDNAGVKRYSGGSSSGKSYDKIETIAVDMGGKMEDVKVYSKDGNFVKYERFDNPLQFPFGSPFIESGRVGKTPKEVYSSITGGAIRTNNDILKAFGGGSSVGGAFDFLAPTEIKLNQESYNSGMGLFQTPTSSGRGTSTYRSPTQEEKIKIDEAQYTGDLYGRAITGVPSQMVSPWSVPFTDDERVKIGGGNSNKTFVEKVTNFLDVRNQFDVFKSRFDSERDLKEAEKISNRLGNLNKEFETKNVNAETEITRLGSGKISPDETTGGLVWTGTQEGLDVYNKKVEDYNKNIKIYESTFSGLSSLPEYQRAINSPTRRDVFQQIADSSFSSKKRLALSGVVGATELGSYLIPSVRVISGAEMLSSGFYKLPDAKTSSEKLDVGFQLGVGTLLVSSGFMGRTSFRFGSGSSTSTLAKVGKVGLKWGLPAGISTYYGFKVTERTGDIYTGIGAGLGGFAGLKSVEIYSGIKQGVQFSVKKIGGSSIWESKRGQVSLSTNRFEQSGELVYNKGTGKWYKKTLSGWKEVDASGKVKLTEKDWLKIEQEHLWSKSGKTSTLRDFKSKFEYVNPKLEKIWGTGDVKQVTAYKSFLEKIYGKEETDLIFKEFFMQQGIWVGGGSQFGKNKFGDNQFTKMSSQFGDNKFKVAGSQFGKNKFGDMQIQTTKFKFPVVNIIQPSIMEGLDTKNKIKQKQKDKLILIDIQKPKEKLGEVTAVGFAQITGQAITPKEIVIPKQIFKPIQKPRIITPSPIKPIDEIGGWIPWIPKLPFGADRKSFIGDIKANRSYEYFPSFKAIAFNIKGKGSVPSSEIRWTGLETRPIFKKRKGEQLFNFPLIKF